jgi:hypothetical protein
MFVVRARSKRENWMLVILRRDLVSVHSRACDRASPESSSPLGFSLQILPLSLALSLAGERRPDWRRSVSDDNPASQGTLLLVYGPPRGEAGWSGTCFFGVFVVD